jgi:putative (di)nucleoside polyphosphate hydrolase
MDMRYFRAGAGTVLYQPTGQIVIFERSDLPGVWQLQQGGADSQEDSRTTAWRELKEETGLTATDILTVTEYPDWLAYAYPPALQVNLKNRDCLGQIHRWYFMALKPTTTIDLTRATDKEFRAWRFSTFEELLTLQVPPNDIKKSVYVQLAHYFTTVIHPASRG